MIYSLVKLQLTGDCLSTCVHMTYVLQFCYLQLHVCVCYSWNHSTTLISSSVSPMYAQRQQATPARYKCNETVTCLTLAVFLKN